MKNFTKVLAIIAIVAVIASLGVAFIGCSSDEEYDLVVGAIMVGDRTEGYTQAHMDGIDAAVKAVETKLNKKVNVIYKTKVGESSDVTTAAEQTIAQGAKVVITNSYGHQYYITTDLLSQNKNVTFVSMTGDLAGKVYVDDNGNETDYTSYTNWKNAFTQVYESRYVSGIVAGKKLAELDAAGKITDANKENGKVKIGYVGAYPYAEVVSGFTSFFLGIQSVYPNVTMTVKYTNSWFNFDREKEVATALISDGCVIIGQHADSEGAPTACETAAKANKVVYSVGYNVSMLQAAPNAALTSSTNNWEVYYEYLFTQILTGKEVVQIWSKGYSDNAVGITALGNSCAEGTQAAVDAAIKGIKDGTIKVFDCAKFTKNGQNLTSYTGAWGMNGAECLKTENGITYFAESSLRSAPYFDIIIDGITTVDSEYEKE